MKNITKYRGTILMAINIIALNKKQNHIYYIQIPSHSNNGIVYLFSSARLIVWDAFVD